tara:strand:+ start:993 stop:1133 length:141 start_codon:yes stop_codon:yes gene_type:complete
MVFVIEKKLLFMGLCSCVLFAMIEIPITLALLLQQESFFMAYYFVF